MHFKSLTITLLTALPLAAQATQLWFNKGTLDKCDSLSIDSGSQGHVTEVTNVWLEGPTGLKSEQTYTNYGGRYHAECVHNDGYRKGDTRFYGFSFRLQQDWQFTNQMYNLAQFIANFPGSCDDWMPSTMIGIVGNQLVTRRKWGSNCPVSAQQTQYWNQDDGLPTVTAGEWHKIVLQISWQADKTGYFKVWYDGTKVLERYELETTVTDTNVFSFRVGLYANGWYDDRNSGGMKGTQPHRQIWYDELAVGTAFADVDPAQWKRSRITRSTDA